jgi:ABC-type branched-subunit amino acid transport system substrate-binding protein
MGSVFSFNAGAAAKMVADGCKNITFIVGDNSAGPFFKSQAEGAIKALNYTGKVSYVTLPLATTDYSSIAAKATGDGQDCIHGFVGDIQWLGLIPAMQALGVKPRLYGPQGNLDQKVVDKFPDATEGAVIIGTYPNIGNDVWKGYRDALEKYKADPTLDWNSLAGLGTWAAFEGFRLIVEKMVADGVTTIDHQTFLDAANATSNLDTKGMVAPLDFTKPWSGGGGGFPRIFNRNVFYDCVTGGKVAPCAEPGPADMTKYQG